MITEIVSICIKSSCGARFIGIVKQHSDLSGKGEPDSQIELTVFVKVRGPYIVGALRPMFQQVICRDIEVMAGIRLIIQ